MPARLVQLKICQVVPDEDEPSCTRRAKAKGDDSGESSKRAEELYELLPLLVVSLDAHRALKATQLCIDALDKEICERDAHRRRFFTQADDGHEKWVNLLRRKRTKAENKARRLCLAIGLDWKGHSQAQAQRAARPSSSLIRSSWDSNSTWYDDLYDILEWNALQEEEENDDSELDDEEEVDDAEDWNDDEDAYDRTDFEDDDPCLTAEFEYFRWE
ncbi:uncharacterized protein TRAVEDRAFT_50845 [Trametes versicolor FP-101664 SS1]|uniref:uncharacterized protein n=1 Tax=Trametes versicolor (strain FP-101664) TaxID=717944 RepID=UPI0004622F10|nr:uncharacterized protein TRAVEDRAFT_50845 [Trametes versicolor FP-101664 SS1]EIW54701.1 hypothetical protein TRAVEDRAFT_50845 [Trametes versicolor FP-101664 SS1]